MSGNHAAIIDHYQKKFLSDMLESWSVADPEPPVCSHFGCSVHLSILEALAGSRCLQHSIMRKETQPDGPQDPVKFVSY